MRRNTTETVLRRHVPVGDPSECWPWQGVRTKRQGYGVVNVEGRQVKAHRLAYEFAKGPIPSGQIVRHACDNPPCCNPAHLLVGTHGDNARDKAERGRSMFGERASTAVLTESNIPVIRARFDSGESPTALAHEFGVSESTIRHIGTRRTWRHLPEQGPKTGRVA